MALLALPALAAVAGCDRVETLAIDVRSDHEIVLNVPSGRCIDALTIETPDIKGTALWHIERDPAQPAVCVHAVTFPLIPPGFRNTVKASVLPKASYGVSGSAGTYAISGNFDVPSLKPLL